ncbi:hypothetical protein IFM89_011060 [Coptis chinensis]|uniref:FAR1 domain-containing protein n=1 Tax=Coptis chinensis TaxID=261450 RepID=A0A835IM30_9MAGN|nr:hypothetical protein IFM89_011060 [Coptis chinensis]
MVELSLEELKVIGRSSSVQESGTSPFEEKNKETCSPTKDDTDTVETPYVGMIFGTSEEAKAYYQSYGVSKGFLTIIRSSNKGWTKCDEVTNIKIMCLHFGSYNKKFNEDVEKLRLNTST